MELSKLKGEDLGSNKLILTTYKLVKLNGVVEKDFIFDSIVDAIEHGTINGGYSEVATFTFEYEESAPCKVKINKVEDIITLATKEKG